MNDLQQSQPTKNQSMIFSMLKNTKPHFPPPIYLQIQRRNMTRADALAKEYPRCEFERLPVSVVRSDF